VCDDPEYAMIRDVAEIELLDEVVEWLDSLTGAELERVVGVVDRLAGLGSRARMPFSRSLGRRAVRSPVHAGFDVTTYHVSLHGGWTDRAADDVPKATQQRTN